jgi:RNAse (barnase) inhibitor barstar
LADITRAGVYSLATTPLDELIRAAEACAYVVFRVDLTRARDKDSLLKAIGHDMAFPEWFGYNWDALADNLGDLGWRPAAGYLVILEHSERACSRAHDDFITTLQIFSAATDEWRERGIALWCLTDAQADDIAQLPAA